jgi:hypothetical protein
VWDMYPERTHPHMGSKIMGANLRFACPAEGCEYAAGFRLSMGEEELPEEHSKRVEILRAEHPNHLAPVDTSTRKHKDVHAELLTTQDGGLNF